MHSPRCFRQSIYGRLAGYDDLNDAGRLAVDPVMRHVVDGRAKGWQAASTSDMGRFGTEVLTRVEHVNALMALSGRWIDKVRRKLPMNHVILDMDRSVSPTHGRQEGYVHNGFYNGRGTAEQWIKKGKLALN
ncbi:MAG: transposase, partial [bacterium]